MYRTQYVIELSLISLPNRSSICSIMGSLLRSGPQCTLSFRLSSLAISFSIWFHWAGRIPKAWSQFCPYFFSSDF